MEENKQNDLSWNKETIMPQKNRLQSTQVESVTGQISRERILTKSESQESNRGMSSPKDAKRKLEFIKSLTILQESQTEW